MEAAERREEWEEFEEDRKEDLEEVRVQAEKDGLEKVHNCHVEIREKRAKKRSKLANALERRAAQLVSESIAKRMAMKNALQKRQREAKNQARIQKLAGVEGEVAGMEQSKHGPETGWLGEAMKEAHGEIETLVRIFDHCCGAKEPFNHSGRAFDRMISQSSLPMKKRIKLLQKSLWTPT